MFKIIIIKKKNKNKKTKPYNDVGKANLPYYTWLKYFQVTFFLVTIKTTFDSFIIICKKYHTVRISTEASGQGNNPPNAKSEAHFQKKI